MFWVTSCWSHVVPRQVAVAARHEPLPPDESTLCRVSLATNDVSGMLAATEAARIAETRDLADGSGIESDEGSEDDADRRPIPQQDAVLSTGTDASTLNRHASIMLRALSLPTAGTSLEHMEHFSLFLSRFQPCCHQIRNIQETQGCAARAASNVSAMNSDAASSVASARRRATGLRRALDRDGNATYVEALNSLLLHMQAAQHDRNVTTHSQPVQVSTTPSVRCHRLKSSSFHL